MSCFVPGTLIHTESGLAPIESIQIGDRVLSQDVETGELAYKPVLRTTVRESKDTRRIRSGSDELHCSPGHPFWVHGRGWFRPTTCQTNRSCTPFKGRQRSRA